MACLLKKQKKNRYNLYKETDHMRILVETSEVFDA